MTAARLAAAFLAPHQWTETFLLIADRVSLAQEAKRHIGLNGIDNAAPCALLLCTAHDTFVVTRRTYVTSFITCLVGASVTRCREMATSGDAGDALECIGAIDQGTQSTRFFLFGRDTQPIASHQVALPQIYPHAG